MRMTVSGLKYREAEQEGQQAYYGARNGYRKIKPAKAFEPVRFHRSVWVTLYHKVTRVKLDLLRASGQDTELAGELSLTLQLNR
jgi:hypothetical protein